MSETKTPSPYMRPGFIAAAIVVLVVILAGVIVAVTAITAPHPGATPQNSSTPVNDADASVCGLEGFEAESSLTSAPDVEWELVGTVAAPASPAVGPGLVQDRLRTCFAHTSEGALFSAVNFVGAASDARTIPLLLDLVADGPGKTAAIEAHGTPDFEPSATRVQVAGFKVSSYTSDEAVVDLAFTVTSANNQLVSMPIALLWQEGDWKIEMTNDGEFPFQASPLASLGGYTPWAGV